MPPMREAYVQSIAMSAPDDVSGLRAVLGRDIRPSDLRVIMIKSEGNGQDNDFTRIMAEKEVRRLLEGLADGRDGSANISIIASGGCEGLSTPHMTVFAVRDGSQPIRAQPALAIGRSVTPVMLPEDIGTRVQMRRTAEAVGAAMEDAGLTADEVEFVEVKTAVLLAEHVADASRRGAAVCGTGPHASKPLTRAATALGVALALGEVIDETTAANALGHDMSVYSSRCCTTPGNVALRNEVLVFGNSARWAGSLRVSHAVLKDMLDVGAAADALRRLGLDPSPQISPEAGQLLRAVICKVEPSRSDRIRGERHVAWHDSDIGTSRHTRAMMTGILGALTGTTRLFLAAGAEHQGPEGGGVCAFFAEIPA